nr:Chain C, SER-LEU-ASP-GLU-TYR-SER-SER-ASP-VAL [uncultured virus]
SLDEYSSDV